MTMWRHEGERTFPLPGPHGPVRAPSARGEATPVRVHLAPVLDGSGPQTERDWLVEGYELSAPGAIA